MNDNATHDNATHQQNQRTYTDWIISQKHPHSMMLRKTKIETMFLEARTWYLQTFWRHFQPSNFLETLSTRSESVDNAWVFRGVQELRPSWPPMPDVPVSVMHVQPGLGGASLQSMSRFCCLSSQSLEVGLYLCFAQVHQAVQTFLTMMASYRTWEKLPKSLVLVIKCRK